MVRMKPRATQLIIISSISDVSIRNTSRHADRGDAQRAEVISCEGLLGPTDALLSSLCEGST